ncbi:MAG: hypothetical protein RR161_03005 [Bacilli bacterium]
MAVKKMKMNWQLLFNVVSIIFIIGCILYFGGRLTYYYLDSKKVIKQESNLIFTILKNNNPIVTEADGLYKIKNELVFKGKEVKNYVEYSGYIWRVIKINENKSVKLIMDKPITSLIYGDDTNYNQSNISNWLNEVEGIGGSGLFFSTLNNPYKYLSSTEYCLDILDEDINNKCKNEVKDQLVTILNIDDYKTMNLDKSFVNNEKVSWLLEKDKEDNLLYINEKGNILKTNNYESLGVKPVITINQRINVKSGNGSKELPIKFEDEKVYVNRVVKIDNDIWNIIEDKDNILKLSLAKINNTLAYSNKTSKFDINNYKNIAYYLNNTFLNSLTYKDKLLEGTFYNSELSDEEGYKYINFFNNKIKAKVGLLNMIDIKNNDLTDYYLMNLTSKLGEVAFVYNRSGKNNESLVNVKKGIVPVIFINKDNIKEGSGELNNPYVVK